MGLIAAPLRGLFAGLFGVFMLFGTSMTIVGAALPKILGDFNWSYSSAGAVIAASAGAYSLAGLFSGRLIKLIGPKASVAAGLGACAIGLAFFASTPFLLLNFLLNAIIGAGQGIIESTVNWSALVMDKESSGRPMNLMHGSFAIGAVAGPLSIGLVIAAGVSWTILFRIIAILFGILGLVLSFMPFDKLGKPIQEPSDGDRITVKRRSPAHWLGFACLLFYVGAEIGISNWVAEYFVRVFAATPAFASLTVSLFWIGLLAGRFGVPLLYRGDRQEATLVLSSLLLVASTILLCAMGFADLASGGAPWAPAAVTFLAGLGCSIIYPTVVSLVGIACKEAQAEALSFAIAGGGLGLFIFPFVMSGISQAWGIEAGFASYAIIATLTAVFCGMLAKVFASAKRETEKPRMIILKKEAPGRT